MPENKRILNKNKQTKRSYIRSHLDFFYLLPQKKRCPIFEKTKIKKDFSVSSKNEGNRKTALKTKLDLIYNQRKGG